MNKKKKAFNINIVYGLTIYEDDVWNVYNVLKELYLEKLKKDYKDDFNSLAVQDEIKKLPSHYLNSDEIVTPEILGEVVIEFLLKFNRIPGVLDCHYYNESKEFLFYLPNTCKLIDNIKLNEINTFYFVEDYYYRLTENELKFSNYIQKYFTADENSYFRWCIFTDYN